MFAITLVAVLIIAVVLLVVLTKVRPSSAPDEAMQNAIAAGWNPADGPPPHDDHGAPPAIDADLGHNGIPPTDAKRIA